MVLPAENFLSCIVSPEPENVCLTVCSPAFLFPEQMGILLKLKLMTKCHKSFFFFFFWQSLSWEPGVVLGLGILFSFFSLENVIGIVRIGINWHVRKADAAMKSKCAEVPAVPD